MSTTIGCPIPGASQPKEPVRLIDVTPILKNIELDITMLHAKADELGESAYAIRCTKDIVKLKDFAKWLKAIPTIAPESLRPTAHWISVKDRLPNAFDEVLVYFNGFISIAWRETEKRKNGIVGWHWDSQMSYPESLVYVTHWMPLPEPPKETNND